ncbi:MAG: hypothetical protein J6P98_03975, partial [Clostridia bacterium]|nr:hypothetical protein [Clostridia bacterium]
MGLFVWLSPRVYLPGLGVDWYGLWQEHAEPVRLEMIEIWHIADFKPYVGSLGGWLEKRAEEYFSKIDGAYYKVHAYTREQALEQLARGSRPDIISFSHGSV